MAETWSSLAQASGPLDMIICNHTIKHSYASSGSNTYTAAQRTGEIGLRMALGAKPSDVQRMVVGQGMRIVAIALIVGVGAALATVRVIGSLLFGVSPGDPATYATVVGVLLAVALLACWIPARRASGVDPSKALRGTE